MICAHVPASPASFLRGPVPSELRAAVDRGLAVYTATDSDRRRGESPTDTQGGTESTVQPPEVLEDADVAAAIVRRDPRLAGGSDEVAVRGIADRGVTSPSPGASDRCQRNSRRAVREATVDMTVGTVVTVRAIP